MRNKSRKNPPPYHYQQRRVKEEWGAEPGTEYYTLHIHEIRERKDC